VTRAANVVESSALPITGVHPDASRTEDDARTSARTS